jgi:hypothetical protein
MSIVAGVSSVRTARHILGELQDILIPSRLSSESTLSSKLGGIAYRMLTLTFIDGPLDVLENTTVHEIFGHGARAREFGRSVSYHIDLPPPYGPGGGYTTTVDLNLGVNISRVEHLAFIVGGIETGNISTAHLTRQWAERDTLDYREALRFVNASLSVLNNTRRGGGSDGAFYAAFLNDLFLSSGGRIVHQSTISRRARLNLVNPFFAYALYRSTVSYLIGGHTEFTVPMLSIGAGIRYVGWLRYVLTPFGPQYGMEHLFRRNDQVVGLGIRISDGLGESTFGAGIRVRHLARGEHYSIGARLEIWSQPEFDLLGASVGTRAGGFGTALISTIRFDPGPVPGGAARWSFDLGYKTPGFVEGEALDRGLVLRMGVALRRP